MPSGHRLTSEAALGVQLSPASIAHFVKTCYQQLAEVESRLRTAVVNVAVLHQDETGIRVGKEGWWVHVCSTNRLTYYATHQSRGRPGMDAIGIAPQFHGISLCSRCLQQLSRI